jgi:hypothetical protein
MGGIGAKAHASARSRAIIGRPILGLRGITRLAIIARRIIWLGRRRSVGLRERRERRGKGRDRQKHYAERFHVQFPVKDTLATLVLRRF